MEPRPASQTSASDFAGHPAPVTIRIRPGADLVLEDIEEAVLDLRDGRLTRARRRLSSLWAQVPAGSAHRSALAHWLAVVEEGMETRLAWDERALEAAETADEWSMPFAGTALTLGAMYPELHLEIARDHFRLGSSCGALEHLAVARNAVEASAQGARRTGLRRQVAALDREIGGMRGRYPDDDEADWQREDEADLVDFWDGPCLGNDEGLG